MNLRKLNKEGLRKQWIGGQLVDAPPPIAALKENKLSELDIYYRSDATRLLTITGDVNGDVVLSLDDKTMSLLEKKVNHLQLKVKHNTEVDPHFNYYPNGHHVTVTLTQLEALFIACHNILESNYTIWREHIIAIKALTVREDIINYDITNGYLTNRNMDLT